MSIFEKIGEKLSGAGQGVAQQVKNFADVARLNSIISEKEKQIAQLYIEIGHYFSVLHAACRNDGKRHSDRHLCLHREGRKYLHMERHQRRPRRRDCHGRRRPGQRNRL